MGYVSTQGLDRQPRWTPPQAVAYARGEVAFADKDYAGMCLHFTAWCYGLGGSGMTDATSAWHDMPRRLRHPHDPTPPAGALVFWTGGSSGHGHATVSAGGAKIYSTDIRRSGKVDLVPLTEISARWGLPYAGWCPPYFPRGWGVNPHPAPTVTRRLPAVRLTNMQHAAMTDPDRPRGGASHPVGVRLVERALQIEGLLSPAYAGDGSFGAHTVEAYAEWQRRCGYSGADADGVPGEATLRKLGAKHGFRVIG